MYRQIISRMLLLPIIMGMVSFLLFVILYQIPAEQRVQVYLPSGNPHISEEEYYRIVDLTIQRYGLDQPLLIQYQKWLWNILCGEWGYSPTWRQTVRDGFIQRAPASIELALFSFIPTLFFALLMGTIAAEYENRSADYLIRATAFLGWAFPTFILGLILMSVFYARLRWFPPERLSLWASELIKSESFIAYTGMHTIDALLNKDLGLFMDAIRHLILPGITLGIAHWALLTQIMRSSLLDILASDYIKTAHAKGLGESRIFFTHATPNAILPFISTNGVAASMFLSNLMVVEVLFNFNGLGRWAVRSAWSFDIQVTSTFVLFMCVIVVTASLVSDTLYSVIDPRIRMT